MGRLSLSHPSRRLIGKVELPGSKSESNRVLMLQSLYFPELIVEGLSNSRDTQLMQDALQNPSERVNVGDAGTAMRFMTAYLAVQPGRTTELYGSARMHQRPIGVLVEALRELGADIRYLQKEGYPPLAITGKEIAGGAITIDGSVSSQFISALMMIAPGLKKGLRLRIRGFAVSTPYLYLTAGIMQRLGFSLKIQGEELMVEGQVPQRQSHFVVEPDWSAASYWYLMALLADQAEIYLPRLREPSMQGDSFVRGLFDPLGVAANYIGSGFRLHRQAKGNEGQWRLNLVETPDLAQTLAVAAAAQNISAEFTGLQTLRIKETDRLLALKQELEKTGASIVIGDDFLKVQSGVRSVKGISFDTYDDHRMAMALAPLALLGEIHIKDPAVVEKSYPHFWDDLQRLGFKVEGQVLPPH